MKKTIKEVSDEEIVEALESSKTYIEAVGKLALGSKHRSPAPIKSIKRRLKKMGREDLLKERRTYTKEMLEEAVKDSISLREVILKLHLAGKGGNYRTIKSYIAKWGIDISHFKGQGYLRGETHNWSPKKPLEDVLVENSSYTNTNSLRKRLLKEGVFEYRCSNCEKEIWEGVRIPLELDHINGDSSDNRKENLRLLCPNCHALTATYRGKNKATD